MMVTRGWRKEKVENYLIRIEFQFHKIKKLLKIDGSDDSRTI